MTVIVRWDDTSVCSPLYWLDRDCQLVWSWWNWPCIGRNKKPTSNWQLHTGQAQNVNRMLPIISAYFEAHIHKYLQKPTFIKPYFPIFHHRHRFIINNTFLHWFHKYVQAWGRWQQCMTNSAEYNSKHRSVAATLKAYIFIWVHAQITTF